MSAGGRIVFFTGVRYSRMPELSPRRERTIWGAAGRPRGRDGPAKRRRRA